MLDTAVNFARGTVNTATGITATTVPYTKTGAQDFPSPSGSPNPDIGYNVVIWDSTDYASPDLDPNVMIFRVTSWVSGTLTGYWVGQNEAIVAQATPSLIAGKTYTIIMGPTAKLVTDLNFRSRIDPTLVRIYDDFTFGTSNFGGGLIGPGHEGGTPSSSNLGYGNGVASWGGSNTGDGWYYGPPGYGTYSGDQYGLGNGPFIMRARVIPFATQATADASGIQFFCGVWNSVAGNGLPFSGNANSGVYAVGFICDTSSTDTNPLNVQCVVEDGTTASRVVHDTGVAYANSGPVPILASGANPTSADWIFLELLVINGTAYFFVNGNLVYSTSSLPSGYPYGLQPSWNFNIINASSVSTSMYMDYFDFIYPRFP